MRYSLWVIGAALLVGCGDGKSPVDVRSPFVVTERPEAPAPKVAFDPRLVTDRLDALFSTRLTKVNIPPDDFSQSSDAVHPDIACPPTLWNGAKCWLTYTPYHNSDPGYENPAVLLATSDTSWATPPGVRNPIVSFSAGAYNSDPDQAFDPSSHRMVQVYRVVSGAFNTIMIMSTANARQWTTPSVAFREQNHDAVSPSLIITRERLARLWYVRTGAAGCATSSSNVVTRSAIPDVESRFEKSVWSGATPVAMSIPKYVIWHLDVIEGPPELGFLAMVAAYPRGLNCANSDLWLASSLDGITWLTYPMPLLSRYMHAAKERSISTWYRGTLRYDPATDSLDLWPSAMSRANWNVYHASTRLSALVELLRAVPPGGYQPTFDATHPMPLRMP